MMIQAHFVSVWLLVQLLTMGCMSAVLLQLFNENMCDTSREITFPISHGQLSQYFLVSFEIKHIIGDSSKLNKFRPVAIFTQHGIP